LDRGNQTIGGKKGDLGGKEIWKVAGGGPAKTLNPTGERTQKIRGEGTSLTDKMARTKQHRRQKAPQKGAQRKAPAKSGALNIAT